MDFQTFLQNDFLTWAMILARVTGLFSFSPFLGAPFIPRTVRVLIVIIFSWLLIPYAGVTISFSTPVGIIAWMTFLNFTIGMAIGLFATIFFEAVQFAGRVYGYQIGFAVANVLDPQTQSQVPILGQLTYLIAAFLFVSLDGPAILLLAVADSLKKVPVDLLAMGTNFVPLFWKEVGTIFSLGIQIGFPIIAFMIIVTIILGVMARIMPQMNVFMVGMPLDVFVGLIMFAMLIPVWFTVFSNQIMELSDKLVSLINGM
ncbi:flagellar biosynthetic protein FliR [Mesoaciditoga lauensis]|uniref:flagellar biosynthetic protein FliR n=1 Tax=Mesoaciditoga lauensis TaxID=1495039 RepID=UPI00068D0923|nr:flagellar biosynthetic protein FliR [Mesoaciditoga lauensis]